MSDFVEEYESLAEEDDFMNDVQKGIAENIAAIRSEASAKTSADTENDLIDDMLEEGGPVTVEAPEEGDAFDIDFSVFENVPASRPHPETKTKEKKSLFGKKRKN